MKKGKIKVYGYYNDDDVVEQGFASIVFNENGVKTDLICSCKTFDTFLEKYNLTLDQVKVSYEYVDYEIEVKDDVITSINIEESQLQNFVKADAIYLFKIPVWMEYSGFINILGTSLKNACERASEDQEYIPIPFYKEYSDGSFTIGQEEDAEDYNDENGKTEETINQKGGN